MTPFDPIEALLEEHAALMERFEGLRSAVRDLESGGDAAAERARPVLRAAAEVMATRLLRHAKKEDEALFPALEASWGGGGGPTAVMRQEHREIHEQAARFRETLRELHEVEHPAIEEKGAELRALAAGGGSAAALRETGAAILRLLDAHFRKEEEILFPMARERLGPETLRQVWERMEAIEAGGGA